MAWFKQIVIYNRLLTSHIAVYKLVDIIETS